MRRFIVLCGLLGMLAFGWFTWRNFSSRLQVQVAPALAILRLPVVFSTHNFDPVNPQVGMPPLSMGEIAVCDSNFFSSASVRGESRKTDSTHAIVTLTQVKITLHLDINIWLPIGASEHVIEHEDGHRQISEFYYQTADKLANRIAAPYMGRQVEIAGTDLDAESSKMLQQVARDITAEYDLQINPGATQLLYDSITDHARNGIAVKEAVDHAIKNAAIESPQPTASP